MLQMGSDLVPVLLGVIVRAVSVVSRWFITRPEVATPLNSWNRLTEGVHLYQSGTNDALLKFLVHTLLIIKQS